MAEVTGSTRIDKIEAVTASTKTRKIIVVGAGCDTSARITAAVERLKNLGDEVELITPEQALERGITIRSEELFQPEPFILTNPKREEMYTNYDFNRKGKKGYTRPYKFHK